MIRIMLSALLGERRMTQSDLVRKTRIRAARINEYYHELTDRIDLNHLDRICEALECDLCDVLVRVPNNDPDRPARRK